MTGKVHTICGVSAAVATAICLPELHILSATVYPAIGVVAAIPGSLLPDIDIERSKLGSKHKWLSKHLTHRGITHTLLIPVIIFGIFFLLQSIPIIPSLLFGFEVGYVAHIFADMFNKKGVPILWPLTKAKLHIACVKTASTPQQVVFIIFWEAGLLLWIFLHYDLYHMIMGML